jgi:hypothetical protein
MFNDFLIWIICIYIQAKKQIEKDQREREKKRHEEGKEYEGVYFTSKPQEDGTNHWVYNEKETLNREFLEYVVCCDRSIIIIYLFSHLTLFQFFFCSDLF